MLEIPESKSSIRIDTGLIERRRVIDTPVKRYIEVLKVKGLY